jgi:pimeloyl-ACP methyl ester carboxylesterase
MARYVLVHGAWHGSWCFGEVVRGLEERGHQAVAVDLPCEEVGPTVRDYAALVGPQEDAVVLGHSLGAQTVSLVRARTRVYLAGVLPVENVFREAFAPAFGGTVRDELDRSYWPDPDTCAAKMYPDCTRAQSDWAFAQLRPQARLDAVVAPFGPGDIVLATMRDAAIDPDWQVATGKKHGVRVIELDAGHSPFITQPDELADLLHSLA